MDSASHGINSAVFLFSAVMWRNLVTVCFHFFSVWNPGKFFEGVSYTTHWVFFFHLGHTVAFVYITRQLSLTINTTIYSAFNNFPTRCDLFSLLHFCRQLYMFRVLTPIIRSPYNCNCSFWYWLTGSTTIRSRCWVPTQQRERTAVDPVNQYKKL